jgi:uncharacterized protein (DUF1697 family)
MKPTLFKFFERTEANAVRIVEEPARQRVAVVQREHGPEHVLYLKLSLWTEYKAEQQQKTLAAE